VSPFFPSGSNELRPWLLPPPPRLHSAVPPILRLYCEHHTQHTSSFERRWLSLPLRPSCPPLLRNHSRPSVFLVHRLGLTPPPNGTTLRRFPSHFRADRSPICDSFSGSRILSRTLALSLPGSLPQHRVISQSYYRTFDLLGCPESSCILFPPLPTVSVPTPVMLAPLGFLHLHTSFFCHSFRFLFSPLLTTYLPFPTVRCFCLPSSLEDVITPHITPPICHPVMSAHPFALTF